MRPYRSRWRIEQVFRTLKRDGLDLEATQVKAADRIMKLAALGLIASCRIIQLVDARDGSRRPATDVLAANLLKSAAHIGATLEGRDQNARRGQGYPLLALLDCRPSRRLELLLQTTGHQDRGTRLATPLRHARRLRPRSRAARYDSPVAPPSREAIARIIQKTPAVTKRIKSFCVAQPTQKLRWTEP